MNGEAAPSSSHSHQNEPGAPGLSAGGDEEEEEDGACRDEAARLAADDLLRPQLVLVPPPRCRSVPNAPTPLWRRPGSPPPQGRRYGRLGNASPQGWSPPSERAGVGGVGMLIRRYDGAALPVVVEHLTPGGPAAQSGQIRPQDRLLAVDGRDVAPLPTGAIAALIAGPEGTAVRLTLSRAGGAGAGGGDGLLASLAGLLTVATPPATMPLPYPAPGAVEEPGPFAVLLVRAVVEDPGLAGAGVLGI